MALAFMKGLMESISSEESYDKPLQQLFKYSTTNVSIPGEYNRSEVLVEIIEDAVKYAKSTGMNDTGIKTFMIIFAKVLLSISDSGSSLAKTTDVLKSCLLSNSASMTSLVSHHTITYISKTLLQHFRIYHYLLYQEQQVSHTHHQMVIDTAEKELVPLDEGMNESEWEKSEKVRELHNQHTLKLAAMKEERQRSLDKTKKEMEELQLSIQSALDMKSMSGLSESEIVKMTRTIVEAKTRQFLEILSYEMSHQEESMRVTLESLAAQNVIKLSTSPSSGKKGNPNKSPGSHSPASGSPLGRKS